MYMKGKFLEYSLNDINEAMNTLRMYVNVLLVAVLIILWVILMRIATREVLLFITSQFLLAVFTFGNSAKSTFDAIIFVFLKHPFDVGDRCVIDGLQVRNSLDLIYMQQFGFYYNVRLFCCIYSCNHVNINYRLS